MRSNNRLNTICKSENIKIVICTIICLFGILFFTNISFAEIPQTPTPTPADNTGISADIKATGNQKQATPANKINNSRQITNTSSGIISKTATPPAAVVPAATALPVAAAIAVDVKKEAEKDAPSTKNTEKESIHPEAAVLAPAVIAVPAAAAIADETEKKAEKDTKKNEDTVKDTNAESRLASPNPMFTVTNNTDMSSVEAPGIINYTIAIENKGNMPLTGIRISDPLLDQLSGPDGDINDPGVLDVDEIWTYTGHYTVTQAVIDSNGINSDPTGGNGFMTNTVTVDFAETDPPQEASSSIAVIQNPQYTITKEAAATKIKGPDTINYTIVLENTGNMSLTGINISDPVLDKLSGPEGDSNNPGVLDVNEIWTYTGSYEATQTVIDANGVDSNNVIDGDGDIDNTVIVDFAETDPPQTAYARVKTEGSIDGDIFGRNQKYLHGFLSVTQSYITNLYKTDSDPMGCWATFLTPGIWASISAPSTTKRSVEIVTANASPGGLAVNPFAPINYKPFQLYLLYSPQLQIYHNQKDTAYQDPGIGEGIVDNEDINQFTNNDSLNRLTHRVDAYISYHSGNRLFLRAMDQYKISYDDFSERAYSIDDKYNSNMFNITGILDITHKLQLRLDYSNFDLNYKDTINSDADRTDNSIAAYLFFRLTAKTSAFVEYEFADIDYATSDKNSHEHRYFGGLRWQMSGKTSGQIKGGFGEKIFDSTSSILPDTDVRPADIDSNNWMAEIQIDHNFNSRTNLTLNAYRRYDETLEHRYDYGDLENFYADYTLAHFVGLKVSREITSKIHLNLDTSFFYDEFKGSRANHAIQDDFEFDTYVDSPNYKRERRDTEFAISPSINFTIFKWLTLNGAYIYTVHDSNYPAHDYFDHTFFVRASLSL